jgi:hypothetical protein
MTTFNSKHATVSQTPDPSSTSISIDPIDQEMKEKQSRWQSDDRGMVDITTDQYTPKGIDQPSLVNWSAHFRSESNPNPNHSPSHLTTSASAQHSTHHRNKVIIS